MALADFNRCAVEDRREHLVQLIRGHALDGGLPVNQSSFTISQANRTAATPVRLPLRVCNIFLSFPLFPKDPGLVDEPICRAVSVLRRFCLNTDDGRWCHYRLRIEYHLWNGEAALQITAESDQV